MIETPRDARGASSARWKPIPLWLWVGAVLPINVTLMRDVFPDNVLWLVGAACGALIAAWMTDALWGLGGRRPERRTNLAAHTPTYAVFLLLAWSIALAALYGEIPANMMYRDIVLAGLTLGVILFVVYSGVDRAVIVACACDMLIVLALLSTGLWLVGVESQSSEWAQVGHADMLSRYGIFMERALFPLTRGATHHAAICSMVAVVSLLYLRLGGLPPHRFAIYAVALVVAIFGILASDGRSALAAFVLTLALFAFARPVLRWLPLLLVVGVPSYFLIVGLLPDSLLTSMSRTGWASEITSGNSRAVVWDAVRKQIGLDPLNFLFGYGANGQVTSGISKGYAYLFRNFGIDGSYASVHNAGIQYLVNVGVIGLAIMLWYHLIVAHRFYDSLGTAGNGAAEKVALCGFSCLVLNGVLDTFGTPVWEDSFLFLTLLGAAAFQGARAAPVVRRRPTGTRARQPAAARG